MSTPKGPCPGCNDSSWCLDPWCTGYVEGLSAGRLAAIRADVELAVRQWYEQSNDRLALVDATMRRIRAGEPTVPLHPDIERDAYALRDQAADCRRWLEATR